MPLPTYTVEQRREYAAKLNIDEQYLYQILRGIRVASPALARRMNTVDPACGLRDLRPSDWRDIWPELADPVEAVGQGV